MTPELKRTGIAAAGGVIGRARVGDPDVSTIGIVGAGHLGSVLARRLVGCGHVVRIANSRSAQTLGDVSRRTGAEAVELSKIAAGADILILAIPLGQVPALPKRLVQAWAQDGVVVVDATNYVPPRDGVIAEIDAGLPETAWVSRQLGVPVVKAFNNITDHSLENDANPAGTRGRIALPVSGDDPKGRTAIMQIVEDLGFTAFDAGPLAVSWRQQIGQPAYCTNPDRNQLISLLDRADPGTVGPNRAQSMALMTKMPDDFPKPDLVRAARVMVGLDRGKPASWLSVARLGVAMLSHKSV